MKWERNKKRGKIIRAARNYRGLSQIKLAEKLGCSQQTISRIEKKGYDFSSLFAKRLVRVLKISREQLEGKKGLLIK